jgi:hypothetical protein
MDIDFTCKDDPQKVKDVYTLDTDTYDVTGECMGDFCSYTKNEVFNYFASDTWNATEMKNFDVLETIVDKNK